MSENRAKSKATKHRKQMTVLLALVGALGVLKEFKDAAEFTHAAIEYREIILSVLYYIGQTIFIFAIASMISLVIIHFIVGIVINRNGTETGDAAVQKHIDTHLNIYMVPVSVISGVIALFGVEPRPPNSFATLFAVLCIMLGTVVVFSLCLLVYSLTYTSTEDS